MNKTLLDLIENLIEKRKNRRFVEVLLAESEKSRRDICSSIEIIECAAEYDNAQALTTILKFADDSIIKSNENREKLGRILLFAIDGCSDKTVFSLLLSVGASPNIMDEEGHTPLGGAVDIGDLETVSLLLMCGADRYIDSTTGVCNGHYSALQLAVRKLDTSMVSLLLSYGADPKAYVDYNTARDCLPEESKDTKAWKLISSML